MSEKLRSYISQIFAVLLLVTICISGSLWEDRAPLVSTTLFLLGVIMVSIASLGRLWCSVYIAGYKTDHLVTEGPYSICRNPLYFFSLIGALGVGFASENLLIPFLVLIGFIAYYPLVIKSEEGELKKLHGDEVEIYCKRVPTFFPKWSLLTEPQEYLVKPVIFKKHMFDALWFIWFVGMLELMEELHELDVLPTMFKIY